MKAILRAIACLSCACLAHASEIVAWKVPLASYSWRHSGPENQTRLTKPPEASLFFHPGDELWDLNQLPQSDRIETDPPLEWVVWNATTSTLVTKSDWNGIRNLHEQLHISTLPKLCRMTLEVFEVHDGVPFPEDRKPLSKLSCVSRFQQKAEAKVEKETQSVHATFEPSIGGDQIDLMDLRLEMTISAPGHPELELKSLLALRNDQPMWIARDFDGKQGLELRVTASVETSSGVPFRDTVRLQAGGEGKSLMPATKPPEKHRVGDRRWVSILSLGLNQLAAFDPTEATNGNLDPFEEATPAQPASQILHPMVEPPADLSPWLRGKVWNLGEAIQKAGISVNPADFCGYDPIRSLIFFCSASESELDKFEALFSGGCFLQPKNVNVSLEDSGDVLLATRSGTTASLERRITENKIRKSFQIEVIAGENANLIDLHLQYQNAGNTPASTLLNSATTLAVGQFQNLIDGPDGKPLLRAKAEIIRP